MINLNNSHCLFKMKCLFKKVTLKKQTNIAAPSREEMHLGHDNRFAFVGNN